MIGAIESFLSQAGPWSLIVVFVAIVLESSAGLGLIFPGETLALIAGAMAADSFYSAWTAFAVVALAAMTGDLTGFTIGHTKGQAVLARWAFARRQYEAHRARLEYYFEHFGGATVFVARFVAVGRAFVPFAAGLSGMRIRKFAPIAIIGGLVWAAVVVSLGYALGSNWRIVEKWLRSLRRRNRRSCYLDGADGRVVARGLPPTGADRRGMESAPYRPLRLRPDSISGICPQPLLAERLPWPSSYGWIARRDRTDVDVRRYRGCNLRTGAARRARPHGRAIRRRPSARPTLDAAVGVIAMLANPLWLAFIVGVGALSYARRREASF